VSHAHEGINAAVPKVLDVCWQSCRVHFMRNALAHAGKSGRRVVSAFIATAFAQDDADAVRARWRHIADQLRPKLPKLASSDEAKTNVVACMTFPTQHRIKQHSTNPIERLNCETKRRTCGSTSSPTKMPSSASSARSCSNRMINGPSSAPVISPLSDDPTKTVGAINASRR
jgi:transposase-like protein